MSIVVSCPQCRTDFEVPPDLADQPVRCHRCGNTFPAKAGLERADGIRVGTAPKSANKTSDADDTDTDRPTPRPMPRSAFPWGPIAIVIIGLLGLLLVFSAGLNVWVFLHHNDNRMHEAMHAERVAVEQRMQAEQARAQAMRQQDDARDQLVILNRELAEARKRLEEANVELANGADAQAPDWGTLEGRVTWKGDMPDVKSLEKQILEHKDNKLALAAPKEDLLDPTWRIDAKTRGVANVCVFLKRPANKLLPIHDLDKARKAPVVGDAPFTFYKPYMAAHYPEWFDGTNRGATGEKLIFKNSSTINRCFKATPGGKYNSSIDMVLAPGKEHEFNLKPQPVPIHFTCHIYRWSTGYVWIFDHPYFAITKADGTFTIPRVPAGMEVQVMAWHEAKGWQLTKEGKTMNLKAGKNVLDIEMSAK